MCAQKAIAVGGHVHDSAGEVVAFTLGLGLHDLEDEVLLAKAVGPSQAQVFGDIDQFVFGFGFEFCQIQDDLIYTEIRKIGCCK